MRYLVAFVALSALVQPARAVDLDFNGVVVATCSLAIGTPGILGLSTSGTALSSEESGGLPGTVTILSIGSNTINVSAPTRTSSAPSGYDTGSESIEVAYFGVGGLSLISQSYTSSPTSFSADNIPLTVLTVNNRILNASGFTAGTYTTRTVVTCN